jgi:inosine-uridine nucleoside N-ribohydrolase
LKIHLDTDFGGDPDDACALAFLLASPAVELVGITTNLDHGGFRAACVRYYLTLAGRSDIPVETGAGVTLTDFKRYDSTAADPRYWPQPVIPAPAAPCAGVDLLMNSIEEGATVVAIGAATNLAVLEILRPGSLSGAPVVFMGGWIQSPGTELPNLGPEGDWNVQCDTRAASILARCADVTLVPLSVTLKTWLRASHMPRLRESGSVGELLARQSEVYARDKQKSKLASANAGLPDDLINFHHDPLTAAVALAWPGAQVSEMRLTQVLDGDGTLRFEPSASGHRMRVVIDVNGDEFSEHWLITVTSATSRNR